MDDNLTKKQKDFADNYLETGNATKAVIDAHYNVSTNGSARAIGSENLTKPNIREYLEDKAETAAKNIYILANTAENEAVKLNANKDILDRAGYKPTEKIDHTSKGEKIGTNSEMDALIAQKVEEELKNTK